MERNWRHTAGVVIVAAAGLGVAYLLRWVLLPFVAAGAVACVAEPFIRWMRRRLGWPRWVIALVALAIVLAIAALGGYIIAAYGVPEVEVVAQQVPRELEVLFKELFGGRELQLFGRTLSAENFAAALESGIKSYVGPGSALWVASVGSEIVMGTVLTAALIFYFLLQGPRLVAGALWMVPPRHRPAATLLAERMLPVLWWYFGGVAVVVAYAGATTWLVARWLLGVEHAAVLALAVGVLELIPVIGPTVSALLIGAVAVSRGNVGAVLAFAGFAFGLRLSIDQFVGPLVLGKAVSLPAPVIIFAMLAGGAIWGVLGVVVAVPTAVGVRLALEIAYGAEGSEERGLSRGSPSGREAGGGGAGGVVR